jgi:hypothetical protein
MIRIDEIYDLVFWPWLQKNRPGVCMYYLDPFGCTGVENVLGTSVKHKHNYITFFDQEPIDLARQAATFDHIAGLEQSHVGPETPCIVVSERDSDNVAAVCERYNWRSQYYFFHGWAALDWYRGYDRCELLEPPRQRRIRRTFMSPNRIIGGDRWHRVIMIYHLLRQGLAHNAISAPDRCPVEKIFLPDVAQNFISVYPDIAEIFNKTNCLPWYMPGEQDHPMTSYRLDLWNVVSESMLYLVTETVAQGRRCHLTEKIFKPIALGMPFMLLSTQGSLAYLRSYGFRTFDQFWDESYDDEPDIFLRCEKIAMELHRLDRMSLSQKNDMWHSMLDVVEHNRCHFYQGGFERVLDLELQEMLCNL